MILSITTDYAIRIVTYLGQHSSMIFKARETAKFLGITYGYFNKIIGIIKRNGLVESIKGPGGGYRLTQATSEITLYDIVKTVQGDIKINRCMYDDGFCSRFKQPSAECPVHRILKSLQDDMIHKLKRTSIKSLSAALHGTENSASSQLGC